MPIQLILWMGSCIAIMVIYLALSYAKYHKSDESDWEDSVD